MLLSIFDLSSLLWLLPFLLMVGVIEIVDISQTTGAGGCLKTGGLSHSYLVEARYVSAITVAADVITGFTMTDVGKWARYDPDKDNTANYTETANRSGGKRTVQQSAFWKFGGVSSGNIIAINNAVKTCDVIAIHIYVNTRRMVQGLEIDPAETGGFALTKVQQTLLQANEQSATTDNEARHEISLVGESTELSWETTLTNSAIEAL